MTFFSSHVIGRAAGTTPPNGVADTLIFFPAFPERFDPFDTRVTGATPPTFDMAQNIIRSSEFASYKNSGLGHRGETHVISLLGEVQGRVPGYSG
jgi:hypothetical protein